VLETYFLERPLALTVILFLLRQERGMTATDLAEEFGVSVPTMYRLTMDMQRLGLLGSERLGRKNIFTPKTGLSGILPQIAEHVQSLLRKRPPIEQKLIVAKKILTEYPVPLSPKASQLLIASVFKHKVLDNLSPGLRKRRISGRVLDERLRLDMVVGTDDMAVGIELRMLEVPRHVHDLLGFIGSLTPLRSVGLRGVIVVGLISSLQGRLFLDPGVVKDLLRFQDKPEFRVISIVEYVTQSDVLSPEFLERIAKDAVEKIREVIEN